MSKTFMKMSQLFRVTRALGKNTLLRFPKTKPITTFALTTSVFGLAYFKTVANRKAYAQDDFREIETVDASEVQEGEIKLVKIGPNDTDVIIMYKYQGKYYASAARCPHLQAPLDKGVMFDDKLYCPWHGAAFSVVTGLPEQGPVFNNLPIYEVYEENGKLIVKMPRKPIDAVPPQMGKKYKADFKKYVILGGGIAALSAVETLRQSGYRGEIILITNEETLPYDRTVLSKNMFNADIDKISIRDAAFFEKYDITVLKNTKVKYVNIDHSLLEIEGRDNIKFDKLLIATGGRPRVPAISGTGLQNVMTLRTYNDMLHIKEAALKAKKIVIVGASFIGMEVAANIKRDLKDNVEVVVIDKNKVPFNGLLGEDIGKAIKDLHEKNGVNFHMGTKVKSLEGAGFVNTAVLEDGTAYPADLVILGTGIKPNTDLVDQSIRIADDGGIYTDIFLQTSVDDIYAAGDVASYPYWYSGGRVRIEHYNEAIQQGQIAAYNMMGKKIPHVSIPFFWSRQYDMSIRYVGNGSDYDKLYIDGDVNALKFIAYYGKENRVIAAATVGRDPAAMIISQAMQANIMPTMQEIMSGNVTVEDIRDKVKGKKGCSRCKKRAYQLKPAPEYPK